MSAQAVRLANVDDILLLDDFVEAIRGNRRPAVDVYDSVTCCSIAPLSVESVARGGAPVEVPDFRRMS